MAEITFREYREKIGKEVGVSLVRHQQKRINEFDVTEDWQPFMLIRRRQPRRPLERPLLTAF